MVNKFKADEPKKTIWVRLVPAFAALVATELRGHEYSF
jgi:hypothetical protein